MIVAVNQKDEGSKGALREREPAALRDVPAALGGDLVPQDIAEILARERHGSKGRSARGGSLGRAFRWLKARRKKKGAAAGGGGANGLARWRETAGWGSTPTSTATTWPKVTAR
ncbi:hypothetical protein ANANG_G00004870 [Anguilla anguilla]|uniref:Uncharacterized protein n=1 Tax=Anguilla anguilla TaxID=7936 RepID=A0A9D3MW38_ANGAN|nr:hypothetical protein ANANG_G00004870 [Anguilla anguilla]